MNPLDTNGIGVTAGKLSGTTISRKPLNLLRFERVRQVSFKLMEYICHGVHVIGNHHMAASRNCAPTIRAVLFWSLPLFGNSCGSSGYLRPLGEEVRRGVGNSRPPRLSSLATGSPRFVPKVPQSALSTSGGDHKPS